MGRKHHLSRLSILGGGWSSSYYWSAEESGCSVVTVRRCVPHGRSFRRLLRACSLVPMWMAMMMVLSARSARCADEHDLPTFHHHHHPYFCFDGGRSRPRRRAACAAITEIAPPLVLGRGETSPRCCRRNGARERTGFSWGTTTTTRPSGGCAWLQPSPPRRRRRRQPTLESSKSAPRALLPRWSSPGASIPPSPSDSSFLSITSSSPGPTTWPPPLIDPPPSSASSPIQEDGFPLDPTSILSAETWQQIQDFIQQRSQARWQGDYARADALRLDLDNYWQQVILPLQPPVLPASLKLVLQDVPRRLGGGSSCSILLYPLPRSSSSSTTAAGGTRTVLNLAHAALGMAVAQTQARTRDGSHHTRTTGILDHLDRLVQEALTQLQPWYEVHQILPRLPYSGSDYSRAPVSVMAPDDHMIPEEESPRRLLTWSQVQALLTSPAWDGRSALDGLNTTIHYDGGDQPFHRFLGWHVVENGLRGRQAADAAFWWAMAGVTNTDLYRYLTAVCIKECQRFGRRPSCRTHDLLAMVERLAAAGLRSSDDTSGGSRLEQVIGDCLSYRAQQGDVLAATILEKAAKSQARLLDLHSDHCALMIWKFSARQNKQQAFLQTAARHWQRELDDDSMMHGPDEHGMNETDHDTATLEVESISNMDGINQIQLAATTNPNVGDLFQDSHRPLVIDVGCGYGISLLGLATLSPQDDDVVIKWSHCNFLGMDLSAIAIGYARGIAYRWNLSEKLAFVVGSAEEVLERILLTYPGPIARILIQFPTPYRLPVNISGVSEGEAPHEWRGNAQLPRSAHEGFMVTADLLRLTCRLLQKRPIKGPRGDLLIQSNCEDVALWMQDVASRLAGFETETATASVPIQSEPDLILTQRTKKWIAMGGRRAVGPSWSSVPLLPAKGRTETEIACILNQTPVHRCILTPSVVNHQEQESSPKQD